MMLTNADIHHRFQAIRAGLEAPKLNEKVEDVHFRNVMLAALDLAETGLQATLSIASSLDRIAVVAEGWAGIRRNER